jgi:hypothetical protein
MYTFQENTYPTLPIFLKHLPSVKIFGTGLYIPIAAAPRGLTYLEASKSSVSPFSLLCNIQKRV